MSDTASLVVRVRADGVDQTTKGLDGLTSSAGKAEKAAAATAKSVSKVGPVAQQAGYQLQDMVVQLQMGTSAFVAIGQQVPQFLGALGPIGAVAGTVVALGAAVGGVLYNSLGDATIGAHELKAASKSLNDALRETESGATVLSDSIIELAAVSERAARAQLASAMADAQTQIRGAQQAAEDAATSIDSFFSSINAAGSLANATSELEAYRAAGRSTEEAIVALGDSTTAAYSNLGATANFVGRLSDELGVSTKEAIDLTDALSGITTARTPEALQAAADKAQELSQANGYANVELVKMAANLQKASIDMKNGSDAAETLKGILNDLGGAFAAAGQEARASAALQIESLRIQTLAGKDQILAQAEFKKQQLEDSKSYNEQELAQAKGYIDRAAQQEIKALDERELAREARGQKSLENQQNRDAKQAESAQRKFDAESTQAQRYLARLEQDNMTELELIKVQEEAKIATVNDYRKRDLIGEEEHKKAISEIQKTAIYDELKLEQDASKEREKLRNEVVGGVDPVAKLQMEHQSKLALIAQYEAIETANHQVGVDARAAADKAYNDGLVLANEERFKAQSLSNEMLINSLDTLSSAGSSAIASIVAGTSSAEDAFRMLGAAILNQAVSSVAELGFQYLKNMIIGQTASAATAAAAVATGATMAAAYAPAAAMASLASFGANAAPATAGIASTVASTQALAVVGAREQGGYMSAGSAYQMAERGKAEIIVPAGNSRAKTMSQMKDMMGGGGGSSLPPIIINQTTGRVDSVEQDQDNEGRMIYTLKESIVSDVYDPNSGLSKALRATRGQPGY